MINLFRIQKNVMSGQSKNSLLRLQIGYTAFFISPSFMRGRVGMQIGLFVPKKVNEKYKRIGFWFVLGLHKDKSIHQLPKWYKFISSIVNFRAS